MITSIVVAHGESRQIGLDGTMPWTIREDLKLFKKITMGHHLIMGRKTFESIGRPLPGRTTIIITRDKSFSASECLVCHSLEEALELASSRGETEAFVVGGGEIYRQSLENCNRLHLSRIQYDGPADTYFPDYQHLNWKEVACEEIPVEGDGSFSYVVLEKPD